MYTKKTQSFTSLFIRSTPLITLLILLITLFGSFFVFPGKILAQRQNFNLTVTPEVQYLRIKPGSKIRHTITLENKSHQPITVLPTIYDFKADGRTGQPVLTTTTNFPYLDLEKIHHNALTIPAQERAQLGLLFSVPKDAPEKEYPLTVVFQSTPNQDATNTSQSQLVGAIGSNLIVLVSHQDQLSNLINIDTIQVPAIVDSFAKVALNPTITNNHFAATTAAGTVTVKDMFGKKVAHFPIFPDTVLGYSARQLRAMQAEFQPDIEPEAVPLALKTDFLLGRYTVEVTITHPYTAENPEEVIAFDTFTFIALPLLPLICVVALTIITIIGVILWKNWKKRQNAYLIK